MNRHRAIRTALATLAALALTTAASCGGDDADTTATTTPAATTAPATTVATPATGAATTVPAEVEAEASAFPVTVEHLWGSTTIEAAPERVVTLGVTDPDVVLALGITPVAIVGFGSFEATGLGPWAEALVEGDMPEQIDADPNLERIAALDPDVIIAVNAGFDEAMYDQLSAIAPTVVRPTGTDAYKVPRDASTRQIAAALGQPERGEELIAETDALYASAIADNADFAGKTAAVVLPYDGMYGAFTPGDNRGQVMAQLGFELPPALAALDNGEDFFIEISAEQVALLDADVLVMLADDPDQRAFVDGDAVLQQVPVVADGRMVVVDTETRGAMTYNSVLSVPYVVEHLLPQLQEALATG